MVIFRHSSLRRLCCVVFVWTASLSHTQLLFACELMHGKPQLVCCCGEAMPDVCPMSENCGLQENTDQRQCCEVSQDSLIDRVMSPNLSAADILTLLLDSPQPPPLIAYQEFNASRQPHSIHVVFPYEPPPLTGDRQTYLRTLRLRL